MDTKSAVELEINKLQKKMDKLKKRWMDGKADYWEYVNINKYKSQITILKKVLKNK